jgi:hypothetical protein
MEKLRTDDREDIKVVANRYNALLMQCKANAVPETDGGFSKSICRRCCYRDCRLILCAISFYSSSDLRFGFVCLHVRVCLCAIRVLLYHVQSYAHARRRTRCRR